MKSALDNLPQIIETNRLVLKKYNFGDGEKYFRLIQNNYYRLRDSFPISLAAADTKEKAEDWIKRKVVGWLDHSMFSFAIYEKVSGEFIGDSIIKNIDWYVPKAEVGYYITKEYEGKGLMQEALKALHSFSFNSLGMERLNLKIACTNKRSYTLAERCGYLREGLHKNDFRTADRHLIDVYSYGITKDMYFERLDLD